VAEDPPPKEEGLTSFPSAAMKVVMTKIIKGNQMNTALPSFSKAKIRLPVKPATDELLQAELDPELLTLVEEERKRLQITKKSVVEWGVKAFLLAVNPDKARKYFDREARRQGLKEE
jgi:hypothetical protein